MTDHTLPAQRRPAGRAGTAPPATAGAGSVTTMLALAARRAASSHCRFKMAAVLASGSRVLAVRTNVRRNSPKIDYRNATFHAEEAALRRVRHPVGAVAYVARVGHDLTPMLARPCPDCQRLLAEAGVTRAYYTVGPGEYGRLDLTPLGPPEGRIPSFRRRRAATGRPSTTA
ncbi:hypothetical protein ACIRS1_05285 [Kitasatospora sp. NPDC101176]|uniref:hypothetical protein n=1 Tax=Kitasatospora sp. NPDC101176 TaxID=3364099 RepID=UPI0038095A0C